MKGLSELLIIVVSVIAVLIAAFVLVSIFGKGTGGIANTADDIRATTYCTFRCAVVCGAEKLTSGQVLGLDKWGARETVKVGDEDKPCSKYVSNCICGSSTTAPVPS